MIQTKPILPVGPARMSGLMPTLIADVQAPIDDVVDALLSVGLQWRNPESGEIVVWNSCGDRAVVESEAAALDHWRQGGLVQLWKNAAEDLAIGHGKQAVVLYFDGCSATDVAIYLSPLANRGIVYQVGPEE